MTAGLSHGSVASSILEDVSSWSQAALWRWTVKHVRFRRVNPSEWLLQISGRFQWACYVNDKGGLTNTRLKRFRRCMLRDCVYTQTTDLQTKDELADVLSCHDVVFALPQSMHLYKSISCNVTP